MEPDRGSFCKCKLAVLVGLTNVFSFHGELPSP
jgi:hypothetical protein